jgi:GNAT superfamily N-acetyltransferase
MAIEVRELNGKKDLRTFIFLPEKIHKDHEGWVHPIYMDEWAFFNPLKNKSFTNCITILALAWDGDRPVGRIMGIINPQYNEIHHERNARFFALECYHDIEIARALLDFISEWAREKGMARLVGPLGFSDKDPQGCKIEGFDEPVAITTACNFPWMQGFYEELGFQKEVDLVSYKIPMPEKVPEYIERISKRVIDSNGYILHEFKSRKEMRPWIVPIFRLVNETFTHIYGFIPLEEKEMHELANRYIPILDPRFVKLVTNLENEPIGFVVSMPELSQGIKRARGRLLPLGWFHILRESRRTKMLTLLIGAVREPFRGKGLDTLMGLRLLESAFKAKMEFMDSHLILEHNTRMRAECERIQGKVFKKFRIFFRNL